MRSVDVKTKASVRCPLCNFVATGLKRKALSELIKHVYYQHEDATYLLITLIHAKECMKEVD